MQETQGTGVQFPGGQDPLEKKMAIHSSRLDWEIPWTEALGDLQSIGSQREGHDWATKVVGPLHTGPGEPWICPALCSDGSLVVPSWDRLLLGEEWGEWGTTLKSVQSWSHSKFLLGNSFWCIWGTERGFLAEVPRFPYKLPTSARPLTSLTLLQRKSIRDLLSQCSRYLLSIL